MLEIIRNPEDKIIRVGIVLMLMLTTVMSVEMRWMECDIWIFYGIPVLLFLGFIMLIW